jgi:O-antigen ligase
VSLVWTLSRSGIAGGAVAVTVLTLGACRGAIGTGRRVVAIGGVALAFAAAVAWKGADTILSWYANTGTLEWRFRLWADSLAPLRDFWLTGSGLNTYGTVMLVYPRTDMSVHPRQAHNDYLQLAIEGGLLVGIPALLLAIATGREIVRRLQQPQDPVTWWIRIGAVAAICGMVVQELSEFSLQIPGVALLFATCVAIAIHEPAPAIPRPGRTARVNSNDSTQSAR